MKLKFSLYYVIIYTVLITGAFLVLFPIYWTLITSFKLPISIVKITYLPWIDFIPSLHAWKAISSQSGVLKSFMNGIVVSTTSSIIAVLLGSMASYGFSRFKYKFIGMTNKDLLFWIISQRIMPPIVVVLAFLIIYVKLNIVDSLFGLIMAYLGFNIALATWLLRDMFKNIPVEIEESALVEGASRIIIFFKIILPLIKPGIVSVFIICFIFSWNEFLFALVLTYQKSGTVPLLLASQVTNTGIQWWRMCVLSSLSLLPSLACAIYLEKHIETGLFSGSIK